MKDYYQILGISKDASLEEIKKAYRKLAHKHHPHKGGDEKKMKEINEAYQILSSKEKREQYDKYGRVFEGGNANYGQASGFDFGGAEGFDFGEDIGDIFGDFFGFRAEGSGRKGFNQGQDISVDLEISLEETLKEIEKDISFYKLVTCTRCEGTGAEPGTSLNECFSCRGTGEVQQIKRTFLGSFTKTTICPECKGEGKKPKNPCNVCKGEGRLKGEEKLKIKIPAGVDNSQVIKAPQKGEAGRKGGKSGDLYIRILIKKHPLFKRKGDDILISIPISFSQAVLGDEIKITTLERTKMILKVPSGTESGKILKISGKGIPHFSGYGRGSMYVELLINTPKKITKEQKESLKKLKELGL